MRKKAEPKTKLNNKIQTFKVITGKKDEEIFFHLKWPEGLYCWHDTSKGREKINWKVVKRNKNNLITTYQCPMCNEKGSVQKQLKANTIFHKSHLPLSKLFLLLFIYSEKGFDILNDIEISNKIGINRHSVRHWKEKFKESIQIEDAKKVVKLIEKIEQSFSQPQKPGMVSSIKMDKKDISIAQKLHC